MDVKALTTRAFTVERYPGKYLTILTHLRRLIHATEFLSFFSNLGMVLDKLRAIFIKKLLEALAMFLEMNFKTLESNP